MSVCSNGNCRTGIDRRLDSHDSQLLELAKSVAESSARNASIERTNLLMLDEIRALRSDIKESEDRRIRECLLRHGPLVDRIEKLETNAESTSGPSSRVAVSSTPASGRDSDRTAASKARATMWAGIGAVGVALALAIIEVVRAWR